MDQIVFLKIYITIYNMLRNAVVSQSNYFTFNILALKKFKLKPFFFE